MYTNVWPFVKISELLEKNKIKETNNYNLLKNIIDYHTDGHTMYA